jgi:hypothetical protein
MRVLKAPIVRVIELAVNEDRHPDCFVDFSDGRQSE